MASFAEPNSSHQFTEAAIFARVVEESGEISPEIAEHMLTLGISDRDQQRVQELVERNQEGTISTKESNELENLCHVADLISLWHSKARRILKPS